MFIVFFIFFGVENGFKGIVLMDIFIIMELCFDYIELLLFRFDNFGLLRWLNMEN